MSKESSPREGITGNTYIDLGATTGEAYEISARSRSLARKVLGDEGYEDRIRQRCSIAVGDFSMADLIRFRHDPVNSGLEALARSAPVIADIRMVQVGIQKTGHDSPVLCALDYGSDIAKARDITRTSAGMIREGKRPALVIGSAVGFVNAAESKEELVALDVPSISVEGTRGGTPVAVAALNEIITIFSELQGREPGSH